ncbi:PIN domain-containing protein [Pseudanabaena sp. lw0831]|uniref:PIN domain-containing protein n=1 Tax=Pseudanabaena sp. lw0831 TaxID=1357935 RepID=UPI0035A93832
MYYGKQNSDYPLLPLTPEIAVRSTRLPRGFHGDPSDRLIVASSLVHKAPLVSKDEKIRQCSYLQLIW